MNEEELARAPASNFHVPMDDTMGKGKLIDQIFGEKCEPYPDSTDLHYGLSH